MNVAASFNLPLRLLRSPQATPAHIAPTATVDRLALLEVTGTAVVETVKLAEDRPTLLVRLYEPFGGRASATLSPPPYVLTATSRAPRISRQC